MGQVRAQLQGRGLLEGSGHVLRRLALDAAAPLLTWGSADFVN
jgi:hypothetical protein